MTEPTEWSWCPRQARRDLLKFLLSSPLLGTAMAHDDVDALIADITNPRRATNVLQFEDVARQNLTPEMYNFIADGSDDMKTVRANRAAFDAIEIRVRRLMDVSEIDTGIEIFGQQMKTPIILAPVGAQGQMHPDGELASARAAKSRQHVMIASTMTSYSVGQIGAEAPGLTWFQLYPMPDRSVTQQLLARADAAGARVVVVTIDGPTLGNRESQKAFFRRATGSSQSRLGNMEGIDGKFRVGDPSLTWDYIAWLRDNTDKPIVLKGIVTREDARLCVKYGVDGLVISNHGGRQEESNRGTLESLPEIVEVIDGRIPVLIDGGFRRGTDMFKALALGANAICIGRAYIWGLAAFGEEGVERVLSLLTVELMRIMKFAGTNSINDIGRAHVQAKNWPAAIGPG
ncbi:MAG: alpha-hydroxy acid oxidase [Gammaproteobacteria bacterium]|jgi:isopentenyl diphosphate isomerase/L-lactate dehydrogenase-like FMN-dependent dehydrogenase|nr:alpha-hydroxy acid oxidase [Gammaproteobacteria bacterium]